MKGMNKKGSEMTLGTIIAIILGITVLVFLIFGFSMGWNNMWSKITILGGGGDNTNIIKQACAIACSTNDKYGFCTQPRKTVLADGRFNEVATCKQLTGEVDFGGKDISDYVSIEVIPCDKITC